MNKRPFIIIPIVLSALMFVPSVPNAHAATGLVCITASTSATTCSNTGPTIGPVTVGSTFSVGIFVQNSDPMGGFDVYVAVDPAILNATSVTLGTLIPTVDQTFSIVCINGNSVTGTCTSNTANGLGVVEASTIDSRAQNECNNIGPCSGMAFTITYKVVGSVANTPISYPTSTGCNPNSVATPLNTCVSVNDFTGTPLSENIQAATVVQTAAQDFMIGASPTKVIVPSGSNGVSKITLTSVNGLTGTAIFQTTPPPICPSCPTWSINPATLLLPPAGSNSSILTFYTNFTTQVSSWNVTVTATLKGIIHRVTVQFTVAGTSLPPDFSMVAIPSSLLVASGHSNSSLISMRSLNGFVGTINLSVSVSPINSGTVVTLFQYMVSVHAGGVATSTLTFQSSITGTYNVNVAATSGANVTAGTGAISHSVVVLVAVVAVSLPPDFSISANPTFLSMNSGQSASSIITLRSINGFSGFVSLTLSPPPSCSIFPCVTWSVSPNNPYLASGGTVTATLFVTGGAQAASGIITVTGSSGFLSNQTIVSYQVLPPPNDFNINVYPSSLIILAGGSATSSVNINPNFFSSSNNFTVTLTASVLPHPGPAATLNPTAVVISPPSLYGFSTLTISTTTTTPAGNYTVTVTGKTGNIVHSVIVNVEVYPPPTIKITPTSGPVGTKVLVQAQGFLVQYGFSEILVTFDDQLVGFSFTSTSSFNFTFNVPVAQPGLHTVKAELPSFGSSSATATASAPFQVTASPTATSFAVTINVGVLYFPGDKVTAFILATQNGQPFSPTDLQLTVQLIKPDGSKQALTTTQISTGLYSASFTILTTAANNLGTYALIVSAHSTSAGSSTALSSFEVKPTWLAKNGQAVATGVTIAGALGMVGLVAWKKGYLKRKDDEPSVAF